MRRIVYYIVLLVAGVSAVTACTEDAVTGDVGHERLAYFRALWNHFGQVGEYDSLTMVTRPFFEESVRAGDSTAAFYAGTYMAQAYLFAEKVDSAGLYLDKIKGYVGSCDEYNVKIAYNSVEGIYAMKSGLNYSRSLRHYLQALELVEKEGKVDNEIAILSNIVDLFYVLSDKSGIVYARQAYEQSQKPGVMLYSKALAMINMGQMLYLSEEYEEARRYCDRAYAVAEEQNYPSLLRLASVLYGDLAYVAGDYVDAGRIFRDVLSSGVQDGDMIPYVYMRYGLSCERQGKYRQARELYEKGLSISYSNDDVRFRQDILKRLYQLCARTGDREDMIKYFDLYNLHMDSVSVSSVEQDFHNLLRSYQNMEYELELQSRDLALMKANHKATLSIGISVFTVLLFASLAFAYLRQRKMYRLLVSQNQKYVESFNQETQAVMTAVTENPVDEQSEDGTGEVDWELFRRAERLMRVDKVFRQKDLSRDTMAEMLQTNRTYLSRAINSCTGKSFPNYVNTYRINEAVNVISDPSMDIPLKELADNVGFTSVKTFYKVFNNETGLSVTRYKTELRALRRPEIAV